MKVGYEYVVYILWGHAIESENRQELRVWSTISGIEENILTVTLCKKCAH